MMMNTDTDYYNNYNNYDYKNDNNYNYSNNNHNYLHRHPYAPRKRPFFQAPPPDCSDDGIGFIKLYVAGIPRTITEEEIHSIFEVYGRIIEIALLKDHRTGQLKEFCFVKYTTLEECDRAIEALNNLFTFPGAMLPIKVRYAEGELERISTFVADAPFSPPAAGNIGNHLFKLYVNGLNKQASKMDIGEIFSTYGHLEFIHIVRDEFKQSRGCAFIQFARRDMAIAAIDALNGKFVMMGCNQPLLVRFADPKKPRFGDPRSKPNFCDSVVVSHFQEPFIRPVPYHSDSGASNVPPTGCYSIRPKTTASSSQSPQIGGKSDIVVRPVPCLNDSVATNVPPNGCHSISPKTTTSSSQSPQIGGNSDTVVRPVPCLNDSVASNVPPNGCHSISPKTTPSSSQSPQIGGNPDTVVRPVPCLHDSVASNVPPNGCHSIGPKTTPSSSQSPQIEGKSDTVVRPVPCLNDLMASNMPPNGCHSVSPKTTASSSQSPQIGGKSDTVCSTPAPSEPTDPVDCDWSEHICPDGYNYYFNCVSCESRWEKPQEYYLFEQQLQKQLESQQQEQQSSSSCEESHSPSTTQGTSMEEIPQVEKMQIQTHL